AQYGNYDDPPAAESSVPRTRRERIRRALQGTNDMARDIIGMEENEPRNGRTSVLGSINRRRQRSPSSQLDDGREDYSAAATGEGRLRRTKRRRLDPDEYSAPRRGIRYGWYGQVDPGRLKLDLVSCDGGEHQDPRHPGTYLGPENVLRHDKSVYCSESPSSNILLRHADESPFCLEKLHIVGPEHGFTAPVREGLVYIAMTLNDLQKYIDPPKFARLNGVHSPPYRRHRPYAASLRSSPERLTLSDALRDPEINAAVEQRERNYARGAESAHDLTSAEGSYYGEDFGFGRTDAEAHCDIPTFSTSDGPDFVVNPEGEQIAVAVLSDEDAGPEETSTQEVLDFRLQRLRLMRRRHDLESWDREDGTSGMYGLRFEANNRDREREGQHNLSRLDALMALHEMQESPGLDNPSTRFSASAAPVPRPLTGELGAEADAEKDENVTCVRFQIKKNKHKVAIKFDPGLSGRFILLKLWTNGRSNVDVQSVIAKGYGGLRYFPAREAR
ncbi:hypothetical protein Tdes44962_MAKER04722, partial [Teratosphaeria destructans]